MVDSSKQHMMSEQKDFYWVEEREPHLDRRKEILKSHPEVKTLFGKNPYLPWSTVFMVIVQVSLALNISKVMELQFGWIYFILLAYFLGATLSHALFLAIHEITHDLAFKNTAANNLLSFLANIPILLPYAMSFKEYHAMHH